MRSFVLTIGDELLSGHVVDTNFTAIAARLAEQGHPVVGHASVGDQHERIVRAIGAALAEAEFVVATGGLGPTPDDITVDAAGEALGRAVVESDVLLARIETQLARAGRTLGPMTRRMARVVEGADLLENPVGQAAGQWLDAGGDRVLVLLPGVPAELRAILAHSFSARLEAGSAPRWRTLRTVGLAESRLAERLRARGVTDLAFLPWAGGVDVRISCDPDDPALAEACEWAVREEAGGAFLGEGRIRLEARVGEALVARGASVAVAESLTGGALGARIVSMPGASRYFAGGWIPYANALKEDLGVRPETLALRGAVSREVAVEMASAARRRAGASFGLAATGIAGPDGGSVEKPVGLVWTALARADGSVNAVRRVLPGDRDGIVERTVVFALEFLRRDLEGIALPGEGG